METDGSSDMTAQMQFNASTDVIEILR